MCHQAQPQFGFFSLLCTHGLSTALSVSCTNREALQLWLSWLLHQQLSAQTAVQTHLVQLSKFQKATHMGSSGWTLGFLEDKSSIPEGRGSSRLPGVISLTSDTAPLIHPCTYQLIKASRLPPSHAHLSVTQSPPQCADPPLPQLLTLLITGCPLAVLYCSCTYSLSLRSLLSPSAAP